VTKGLADTSLFIANETGRRLEEARLPDELSVSIITIAELRAGVLAASDVDVRVQRLNTLTAALQLDPIPIDDSVAERWAALRIMLRDRSMGMPVNDSWIAATAMSQKIPVVTQDDDFPSSLPGLDVLRV